MKRKVGPDGKQLELLFFPINSGCLPSRGSKSIIGLIKRELLLSLNPSHLIGATHGLIDTSRTRRNFPAENHETHHRYSLTPTYSFGSQQVDLVL